MDILGCGQHYMPVSFASQLTLWRTLFLFNGNIGALSPKVEMSPSQPSLGVTGFIVFHSLVLVILFCTEKC